MDLSKLSETQQVELMRLLEIQASHQSPFANAWEFLRHAVWTKDEASGTVRRFPTDLEWRGESRFGYLEYLTSERHRHKVRLYDKSRRMMITWWLVALYLYDIMTETNHLNAVASDKLAKSAYLLGQDRMQFIYDHIPPCPRHVVHAIESQGMDPAPFREQIWPNKPTVVFEQKEDLGWRIARCDAMQSSCMAVASGESQMQQYTFTNVLMDEFSRWQWQRESWRNIQPTLQGGGSADIVCTPELGTFAKDLVFDLVR